VNQPAVTLKQIMDAGNRALAILIPIMEAKGVHGKDGLYLTAQFLHERMSATFKVGIVSDPEKQANDQASSQERAARLLEFFASNGHKTSRESRDFELEKYAGAVLVSPLNLILAPAGLPEDADEALGLYVGCDLAEDFQAEAYKIAQKAENDYFFRMLSAKTAA
jgi:hypothetical protein